MSVGSPEYEVVRREGSMELRRYQYDAPCKPGLARRSEVLIVVGEREEDGSGADRE